MWLGQYQRLDQIGPISHMGPSLKKWLVQYIRWDQIGPMTHLGPGPISDIGHGPMWHMGLAYYWQVRVLNTLMQCLRQIQLKGKFNCQSTVLNWQKRVSQYVGLSFGTLFLVT